MVPLFSPGTLLFYGIKFVSIYFLKQPFSKKFYIPSSGKAHAAGWTEETLRWLRETNLQPCMFFGGNYMWSLSTHFQLGFLSEMYFSLSACRMAFEFSWISKLDGENSGNKLMAATNISHGNSGMDKRGI
ncbi:uncharacterized protein [Elaeis guineensis]|uniref:Uncharacterized protein LOC105047701 isoform X2 n=1 Tax=Elaeis guineensis var. tenera TaxID=51953 RepID=A0A6J0PDA6_ELAGV|nr:uncharacterized protein LOC105047701 isoform X2 [Elaeis guineensis]